MNIALNPSQINFLVKSSLNERFKLIEQDAGTDPSAQQPKAGTSSQQTGGQGYPEVGKWESGIERGPANQLSVTKWSDVVGSKLTRGKANQLKEQNINTNDFYKREQPRQDGYIAAVQRQTVKNAEIGKVKFDGNYKKVTQHLYRENDGEGFWLNLVSGEISEALLDLRKYAFSTEGLIVQIVVGIAGSEIGVPVLLQAMDAAIIFNDIYLYFTQGQRIQTPENIQKQGVWESFKWQLTNNPDFLRFIEDVLIVLTFGAFRGAQSIIKFFGKNYMKFRRFLVRAKQWFSGIWNLITKLPKKLYDFFKDKFEFIQRVINFFERLLTSPSKYTRALGKIPKATIIATTSTLILNLGISTFAKLFNISSDEAKQIAKNPNNISEQYIDRFYEVIQEEASMNDKLIEDSLYEEAILEFKGLKRENFKITKEKYKNEKVFIINGAKHYVSPDTGKFTKI